MDDLEDNEVIFLADVVADLSIKFLESLLLWPHKGAQHTCLFVRPNHNTFAKSL